MRWRLAALGLALAIAATGCAQVEAPLGGPEQFPPPQPLEVRPDSLSVIPDFRGDVVVIYRERLSEQGLDEVVRVTPRTSEPRIERHLNRLRVGLRARWEPDRIYQVTVLPGLQDRFGGSQEDTLHLVFSTGPEIPETELTGRVTDRITGEATEDARVEAILAPDSLVYATYTNSEGEYRFRRIPEGDYRLRAFNDLNRNLALDAFEPRDTAEAVVAEEAPEAVAFRLLQPDTTPPVLASAEVRNGFVVAEFDDFMEPEQEITPAQVTLEDAAGAGVPIVQITVGEPEREPEEPDDPEDQEPADPEAEEPTDTLPPADTLPGDEAPAPDTIPDEEAPEPDERLPSQELWIETEEPLEPGDGYRLVIEDVRNVNDLVGGGEAEFDVPEPEPEEEEEEPAEEEEEDPEADP